MNSLQEAYAEFVAHVGITADERVITRAAFVAGVVAGMRGANAAPRVTLRELDEELYWLEADLLTLRAARGLA